MWTDQQLLEQGWTQEQISQYRIVAPNLFKTGNIRLSYLQLRYLLVSSNPPMKIGFSPRLSITTGTVRCPVSETT